MMPLTRCATAPLKAWFRPSAGLAGPREARQRCPQGSRHAVDRVRNRTMQPPTAIRARGASSGQ
eukprot:11894692-Alexandrium_andersonii.AAC.1